MKKTQTPKSPPSKRKRILLVEDHPLTREGLARWINSEPDLEVCAQTGSAAEVISLVARLTPDILITDISLPEGNGLELLKDLKALHPALPVLVLSMHDESAYANRVLRAGGRGYVMKSAGGAAVVAAIREVLAERYAFSPQILGPVLESLHRPRRSGRTELANLTDREFEVLQLIGEAKNNSEIAAQLHLGIKTVQTHRMNLSHKLKITSPEQLLRFALQYVQKEA